MSLNPPHITNERVAQQPVAPPAVRGFTLGWSPAAGTGQPGGRSAAAGGEVVDRSAGGGSGHRSRLHPRSAATTGRPGWQ